MLSPYGMEIVESCLTCKLRADRIFCDLPATALQTLETIKYVAAYPPGAVLFVEGQMPRGIFVLCKGTVKLSINSPGRQNDDCGTCRARGGAGVECDDLRQTL